MLLSTHPQCKDLAEVCSAIGRGPQIGQGKEIKKITLALKRKIVESDKKSDEEEEALDDYS